MSYQVLARKWRPKNFETLVGQEHVVRALTHALEQKRLHHAYLFTGTRGVGKTTLSRILAKALNCVGPNGDGDVTAHPCGVCQPCLEIDAGRFVDYIEMDAASNRGVEEMAQLLEQAAYAPSYARFKVYMIDEVHMLSTHAFNAMLKTLEEPPDYVKFILATTDPQKVPLTVLSRCLQFNLKQMPASQISGHLAEVLGQENITFEASALGLVARAAQGSMRDALSIADQAIAFCAGDITEQAVRNMLGALDQTYLVRILDALAGGDGAALLGIVDEIAARSLSYGIALQDLGSLLHHIALAQSVPAAVSEDWPEVTAVMRLAQMFSPEEVQLYYEIITRGRGDLSLAPDEYAGFSMTLLRMLAFRPTADSAADLAEPLRDAPNPVPRRTSLERADQRTPLTDPKSKDILSGTAVARPSEPAAAVTSAGEPAWAEIKEGPGSAVGRLPFDGDWLALATRLKVTGLTRQLLQQSELIGVEGATIRLRVPMKNLLDAGTLEKLKLALSEHFGCTVMLSAQVGPVQGITVAAVEQSARAQRQASAVDAIESDPFVKALVKDFGATVVPGSIKPTP